MAGAAAARPAGTGHPRRGRQTTPVPPGRESSQNVDPPLLSGTWYLAAVDWTGEQMISYREVRRRAKIAARVLLSGRTSALFEDEVVSSAIRPLKGVPESDPGPPRLNILTPTLSASNAFGGVMTLVDVPMRAFAAQLVQRGWRLRFVSLRDRGPVPDDIAAKYARRAGVDPASIEYHFGGLYGEPLGFRASDLFFGSLWTSFYSVLSILEQQAERNGGVRMPYGSFVQDYEPGFNPWSSAYMLARAFYDSDWPRVTVFNSSELARFYLGQGHDPGPHVVFEPVMTDSLRSALSGSRPAKERCIVFYGRPNTRRNCFYLGRNALERWSRTFPSAREWTVVSAGTRYAPFELSGGRYIEVAGKLSLEDYANLLSRAAVGLSLMASPHPSYPPLEMAHFGALTITNGFGTKDLSTWHENIRSIDAADPYRLSEALSIACADFEADPGIGLRGRSLKLSYLAEPAPETIVAIGRMLASCRPVSAAEGT